MNIIVAGGREFTNYPLLRDQLDFLFQNLVKEELVIISGTAKGADTLAIQYATERGIKLIKMPANWDKYKKRAGFIRNQEMANIADGLVAFWDGRSRGTAHMIETINSMGKKCRVVRY